MIQQEPNIVLEVRQINRQEHRERALFIIFKYFATIGGISHFRKATMKELQVENETIDLGEFLLFCKHFELPISSKV